MTPTEFEKLLTEALRYTDHHRNCEISHTNNTCTCGYRDLVDRAVAAKRAVLDAYPKELAVSDNVGMWLTLERYNALSEAEQTLKSMTTAHPSVQQKFVCTECGGWSLVERCTRRDDAEWRCHKPKGHDGECSSHMDCGARLPNGGVCGRAYGEPHEAHEAVLDAYMKSKLPPYVQDVLEVPFGTVRKDKKMKVAWLIEYRENRVTTGYIADITKQDGYDVHMTRDANEALQFSSRESAQGILDDTGFRNAMGDRPFYVEEHGFYE